MGAFLFYLTRAISFSNQLAMGALFEQYEQAVCMIDETECWSARDLQKLFGYSLWQNFCKVIAKAKEACENVDQPLSDHFIDVNKMIIAGKGAKRDVEDILSCFMAHPLILFCRLWRCLFHHLKGDMLFEPNQHSLEKALYTISPMQHLVVQKKSLVFP